MFSYPHSAVHTRLCLHSSLSFKLSGRVAALLGGLPWPQGGICTPHVFFHIMLHVSLLLALISVILCIFMCLTSLSECEFPRSRDSLCLTLAYPLLIPWVWHITQHKCFTNQYLSVDTSKRTRFILCGPSGVKD